MSSFSEDKMRKYIMWDCGMHVCYSCYLFFALFSYECCFLTERMREE